MTLLGPFKQIVTMTDLPQKGKIADHQLKIIENGGILVEDGIIKKIDHFRSMSDKTEFQDIPLVALPGFVDAHTHICFAGSREKDYALRVSGTSYQEIAAKGGGILDTVAKTRKATHEELLDGLITRLNRVLHQGITTCEVKSGYGLTIEDELKMLRVIAEANQIHPVRLIPTCLAAHTLPKEFSDSKKYLHKIIDTLFPIIKNENLSNRIDIFIEKGAFSSQEGIDYLRAAKNQGFHVTVHANQFSSGGAEVAAAVQATSADHLEHLSQLECKQLQSVIGVALPGASLGLGMPFAPVRMMLDEGMSVAIASDWNPGSAPMGQLLTQAATLGASEKLSIAETLAGLTVRAANALNLDNRGVLQEGYRADIVVYPCSDYREILYYQGSLHPMQVYINGIQYV